MNLTEQTNMTNIPDDIQAYEQELRDEELSPETLDALESEAEDDLTDYQE